MTHDTAMEVDVKVDYTYNTDKDEVEVTAVRVSTKGAPDILLWLPADLVDSFVEEIRNEHLENEQ